MYNIWLITSNPNLAQIMHQYLPSPIRMVNLPNVERARSVWGKLRKDQIPQLIFLESAVPAESCRELLEESGMEAIPLIAIISKSDHREAVFAAGADDYLIMPISSQELNLRLETHLLRPTLHREILFQIINSLGNELISFSSPGMRRLADTFNAQSAWLGISPANQKNAQIAQSYNLSLAERTEAENLYNQLMKEEITEAWFAAPPLIKHQTGKHIILPIKIDGKIFGALGLLFQSAYPLSRFEQRALALISPVLGQLLEARFSQNEIHNYLDQYGLLVLTARLITEGIDFDKIASRLLQQILMILDAKQIELWLTHEDPDRLDLISSYGSTVERRLDQLATSSGLIASVFKSNRLLHLAAANTSTDYDPQKDRLDGIAQYALLAVPLQKGDRCDGVLAAINRIESPFSNQSEILLETIAKILAIALENTHLAQELRQSQAIQRKLLQQIENFRSQMSRMDQINGEIQ